MTVVHLEVLARATPELLERVCRVLRHRGATLEHLVLDTTTDDAPHDANVNGAPVAATGSNTRIPMTRIEVQARLRGEPDLIVRQLTRLPDVHLARHRDETGP